MKRRTRTDYIVVHGAFTPPGMDIGAADIDSWHVQRGFAGIGYHYVIRRDGTIQLGRRLDSESPYEWCEAMGAGVLGVNDRSVHACLVGGKQAGREAWEINYTQPQWQALQALLSALSMKYPQARIVGHRDLDKRECPGFDVAAWLQVNPLNTTLDEED